MTPAISTQRSAWASRSGRRPVRGGWGSRHVLGRPLEIRTRRKVVEPRTATQKAYAQSVPARARLRSGPAGTGKTYLAVAAAVAMFIEGAVDRIILSRPAVEAGERLGFLPGDMKEKVDPLSCSRSTTR